MPHWERTNTDPDHIPKALAADAYPHAPASLAMNKNSSNSSSGHTSTKKNKLMELNSQQQPQKHQDVIDHQHSHAVGWDSAEKAVEDLRLSSMTSSIHNIHGPNHTNVAGSGKRVVLPPTPAVHDDDTEDISEALASRLCRIRATVQRFLSQRYSVSEYTVPRLFVVLPDDDDPSDNNVTHDPVGELDTTHYNNNNTAKDPSNRFRVYFLCECSASFTVPLGSGLNHLHISKHPGYDIDPGRLDEFFKRYGSMILMLLYFLKYGHDPAMDGVPPTSPYGTTHLSSRQGQEHGAPGSDALEATLRKVEKVTKLRRSDLPESIAQDVSSKFDRMIDYLEGLPYIQTISANNTDSTMMGPKQDEGSLLPKEEDMAIHGLSSLSDLHLLYSFLGIADINKRLQHGQLGNLYRVNNLKGEVGWVCVYHYRWTFTERNIDEFERWVLTRRGLFDKQSGSVSITLVSRSQTRTFSTWITKVGQSMVEMHIKLGWHFGKKDMARLAKALTQTSVTILSLDGCSYAEDSTYNILHKKYDPILYLITHGQLHSLELSRFPSMFARLSSKTVKAPTLKRLAFGPGMQVGSRDRGAFSHFIASCSSLEHLLLPGFVVSESLMQSIMSGIRNKTSLVTLDLSNSQLNDGGAIILAQGLFSTNICHLDLSRNDKVSDASVARVIRAIGPRLTSLKMAQTGFGDVSAAALAKSMDGISITNALRDQLHLQHRLDVAAIVAGHRPGLRITVDNPAYSTPEQQRRVESREKTHSRGHLVYLDIEDNQCTVQGFKWLARVKSDLQFIYLNISGSKALRDKECAQILERVASSALVTLRLAWTGFGDLSAKVLAKAIVSRPADSEGPTTRMSGPCQLEELDLQACSIGPDGLRALSEAFAGSQVASCLRILDLGHCSYLHDRVLEQLVGTLVMTNGALLGSASGDNSDANSSSLQGRGLPRSSSDPTPRSLMLGNNSEAGSGSDGEVPELFPPRTRLAMPAGFFTNLRQLDLKSTQVGDGTAWLLSQALVQSWTMLHSLTLLDPVAMSVQGMCWILEALAENTTVQEVGIGKSSNMTLQSDLDNFGSGIARLLETNKRIRSLTTLGAPLGPIARGMLLNQSLHSLYVIRSKGQFEDLQLMGQALGFTRTLLVFWMGGSDDFLLGPLQAGAGAGVYQDTDDGGADGGADAHTSTLVVESMGQPRQRPDHHEQQQQQQQQQQQPQQQQQQPENVYRDFHMSHQQKD
ncbi:hypothetical protein BGX31_001054 [Mortierella sp. GBA43]|nr:hypothetical protein BGX31_001054 [Mortierella sp. GBA43]